MRWGRLIRKHVLGLLAFLGKPFFWIIFGVATVLVTVWPKIVNRITNFSYKLRVITKFTWNITHSRLRRLSKRIKLKRASTEKSRNKIVWLMIVMPWVVAGICGVVFYVLVLKDLPHPKSLLLQKPAMTTKIYDRNGVLLYKVFKNENRSLVTLKEIPPYVIEATLAIEDAEFYRHPGFSVKGILRAFSKNVTSESTQGGSTITQQLVKNTLLTSERTLTRKIKELVLSIWVEHYFTKDEILTMYINEVGYGGTAYGIEEAAQQYFGKSVREVNLAEAALLAGLPQSPTTYSPFGSSSDLATLRQHAVLSRMRSLKMISDATEKETMETKLYFAEPKTDIIAPHFVMYVKDQLTKRYGDVEIYSKGLEVYTTLDVKIQKMAEEAVSAELKRLTNMNVSNGAAMVTNPTTGEILAMVGSVNYFDTKHDGQVNVTLRPRQPGSSIKPLTYALALQKGLLTPSTLIDDAPITYSISGSKAYSPQNYDGRFHGRVNIRQALANSYNIPAVKTLAMVGVSQLVDFAATMGITTWNDPGRFGLSLTLGGGEVLMRDMTEAYGVFANSGKRVPLTSLIRVSDYSGAVKDYFSCDRENSMFQVKADSTTCEGEAVLSPEVSYIISNILSDNVARAPAFGMNSVLNIPDQQVAVKTGTTNDLRDNWTFGYTNEYLVASWVGNNNNNPMSRVASGITGASPIWQSIMKQILHDKPKSHFDPPSSMVKVSICPLTQTLYCGECPNPKTEYFIKGTEPKVSCNAESVQKAMEASPDPTSNKILEGWRSE